MGGEILRRYLLLILVLLCATVLCLPNVNIENTPVPSVGAEQVYTIGSDYSVSPSDGPLAFDGADYVLTDDLVGSIEVYAADIIIDGKWVIELKACPSIKPEHVIQTMHYMERVKAIEGYVINFPNKPGAEGPEVKKLLLS